LSVGDLRVGGGVGCFVFRKACFIIKRGQSWDALVAWIIVRESYAQAGTKLNPQCKSLPCSERRIIQKGA